VTNTNTTQLRIEIDMANAAFGDTPVDHADELDRIFCSIATRIANGSDADSIIDTNGNRVGSWAIATGTADS
jgi:hypothetical protein